VPLPLPATAQVAGGQVALQGLLARARLDSELEQLQQRAGLPLDGAQLLSLALEQQELQRRLLQQQQAAAPGSLRLAIGSTRHQAAPKQQQQTVARSSQKLQQLRGLLGAAGTAAAPALPPPAGAFAISRQQQWGGSSLASLLPLSQQAAASDADGGEASPEGEIRSYLARERRRQGLLPAAVAVQSAWRALGPRLRFNR
jgi:hypothetical protein